VLSAGKFGKRLDFATHHFIIGRWGFQAACDGHSPRFGMDGATARLKRSGSAESCGNPRENSGQRLLVARADDTIQTPERTAVFRIGRSNRNRSSIRKLTLTQRAAGRGHWRSLLLRQLRCALIRDWVGGEGHGFGLLVRSECSVLRSIRKPVSRRYSGPTRFVGSPSTLSCQPLHRPMPRAPVPSPVRIRCLTLLRAAPHPSER